MCILVLNNSKQQYQVAVAVATVSGHNKKKSTSTMGKSKKGGGKRRAINDTRGYGSSSSGHQQQTTAAPPSSNDIIVTKQTHDGIKSLVDQLRQNEINEDDNDGNGIDSSSVGINGSTSAVVTVIDRPQKFVSKFTKIIDILIDELGFVYNDNNDTNDDDIDNTNDDNCYLEEMVITLGYTITLELALDWLCLNVPTLQLPPLFTDGNLRNNLLQQGSSTSSNLDSNSNSLEVLKFISLSSSPLSLNGGGETNTGDDDEGLKNDKKKNEEEKIKKEQQQQQQQKEQKKKAEKDAAEAAEVAKAKQQQKKWLLEQYAGSYEDDDDDDYNDDGNGININKSSNDDDEDDKDAVTVVSSQDDNALIEKQNEIKELEIDLNCEANNYMRSKAETKQLRMQLKKMKQQLVAVERKIERKQNQKQKLEREQEVVVVEKEKEEEDDCEFFGSGGLFGTNDDDDDDDDDEHVEKEEEYKDCGFFGSGGLFGTNDGNENDNGNVNDNDEEVIKVVVQEETTISSKGESTPLIDCTIPKGWTGMTPRKYLEDLCSKKQQKLKNTRYGKPKFSTTGGGSVEYKLSGIKINNKNKEWIGYENNFITVGGGGKNNSSTIFDYLAMQVLYGLDSNKPLYGMFPPTFRFIWLSWNQNIQKEKDTKEDEQNNQKLQRIQKLIYLIEQKQQKISNNNKIVSKSKSKSKSKSLSTTTIDVTDNNNDDQHPLAAMVEESWEDMDDDDDDDDKNNNNNIMGSSSHKNNDNNKSNNSTTMPTTATTTKTKTAVTKMGKILKQNFIKKQSTKAYIDMLHQRKNLPMTSYRNEILTTIRKHQVTILCAETGAGKTTQCPQYLLEEALMNGQGDLVNIICTQPRRVAATSVAERVAEEMTDRLGNQVGYQIRMESKRSKNTKLLFCTTGVILRRLQDDHELKSITHVIVDEVHERQVQTDVLLIALRQLLRTTRRDLKVVLMSATLDSTLFSNFFNHAPVIRVPGRTFPVSNYYLEDLLDATNHIIEEGSQYAYRQYQQSEKTTLWVTSQGGEKHREVVDVASAIGSEISETYAGYSMPTRLSLERVDESILNYDLIEDVLQILLIHPERNSTLHAPDGADTTNGSILIFLPGIGEIRSLTDRLSANRTLGNKSKFSLIPLHSKLSSVDQRKAFLPVKAGCRKIILSTNIAETSVTIQDVIVVIDCGREREVRRNKRTSTSILVTDWCAKANTKQRAGRAGRVQPGLCLKLFSSNTAESMKATSEPELKRVPLEEVCLSILASGLGKDCEDFLRQAPQPPSDESVQAALTVLEEVGAITSERKFLTPLGQHLAKLPVDVRLGKMLILGSLFQCLDKVLTIAASLSSKSPFSTFLQDAAIAKAKHKQFQDPDSDFATFCNVWEGYTAAKSKSMKAGRQYCQSNYLNQQSMHEIGTAKKDFLNLLCGIGFVDKHDGSQSVYNSHLWENTIINRNSKNWTLVHAIVFAGLNPNVARLEESRPGSYTLWNKDQQIHFHRTSVHASKKRFAKDQNWVVFFEKFGTPNRISVTTTCFVNSMPLLLFGGPLVVKHTERIVVVDEWMEIEMAAQIGVMLQQLRRQIEVLLLKLVVVSSNDNTTKGDNGNNASSSGKNAIIKSIVDILSRTSSK